MAGLLRPGQDAVASTLEVWARLPFKWGSTDCFLSVLDHVEFATGRQLQARPRYSNALGAQRILQRWGGFEAYCSMVMAQLGCPTTVNPERGDVGLVRLPDVGLTMCLCIGELWAARGDHEVLTARCEPEIAWRVVAGGSQCPRR